MKVHQDSRSQNANLRFLSKPFSPITEIRTASPPRQIQILSKFFGLGFYFFFADCGTSEEKLLTCQERFH